jgi:hypothetical protein
MARKVAAKVPSVDPWTDLKRMRTVGDLPSLGICKRTGRVPYRGSVRKS